MPTSKDEIAYKKKAAENYAAARELQLRRPNASASRAYYAVFLAAVSEFERIGVKPQLIDRGAAESFKQTGTHWTHSFVRSNGRMIGLDGRQCEVIKSAYDLRCTSDYEPAEVNTSQLAATLTRIADVLECLGVKT